VRIAHLADLHLGYRAYHRVTPRGQNVREADVAAAFRHAVARLGELAPDLVVVAGDFFHSVRPSNTSIAEAFRQLSVLSERLPETPVVIIAGNHDSPRAAETGNILHLFREIRGVRVVCDEARSIHLPEIETSVLCLPHVALAGGERVAIEPDPGARHNVLTLHGTVAGEAAERKLRYVTEYGGAVVDDRALAADHWSYVALGHHHLCTDLAPNMWYAGGIERTSTNPWIEEGEKGFLVYDTATHHAGFHAVPTRAMVDLPPVEAAGLAPAEVDAAIEAAVAGVEGGIAGAMVRLVVRSLPRSVARELTHRRIREWKAEAVHFHLDLRPPDARPQRASGAPVRRRTLEEQVSTWLLRSWEVRDPRLERDRLAELGVGYVERTASEG
jgi:DNA repair protein SbcD/Mre11